MGNHTVRSIRNTLGVAALACAGLFIGSCAQAPAGVEHESEALQQAGASAQAASDKHGCKKHHGHGHGPCKAVCGNGVVEDGEACDDGNTQPGDGCDASCQIDDNLATPGDDRAGYKICTDMATGQSFECGPGLGCCTQAGMKCLPSNANSECGTSAPFFDVCDGPEDCVSSGTPCWSGRFGRICDRGTDGSGNACHTDADCIANAPVCDNGRCRHTQP